MTVEVVEDRGALARAVVALWRGVAARAVQARGRFVVAISGGSTPVPAYQRLAHVPDLPWHATDVLFADERCVPPYDPASNFGEASRALLASVPARVHRVRGERSPEDAARDYEERVRPLLPLDLALLGIGSDGHTASLFPGDPALEERTRVAVATRAPAGAPGPWRVTLTPVVLDAALEVAFLVDGAEKREVVARVLRGEPLPAARVAAGRARMLITRSAAQGA